MFDNKLHYNERCQALLEQLPSPATDLKILSVCDSARPAKIRNWLNELPATRINLCAAQLYKALPEIARLNCPLKDKLEILEDIFPFVEQCLEGLSKQYLGQPLAMPEPALKSATLAQALQKHLYIGYLSLLKQAEGQKKTDKLLPLAIYRALYCLGQIILRSMQLYIPVPSDSWLKVHKLYQLAQEMGVPSLAVHDSLSDGYVQIRPHYLALLLLSISHPNQLRQFEIKLCYQQLILWSEYCQLSHPPKNDAAFFINCDRDQGVQSKARLNGGPGDTLFSLSTVNLTAAMERRDENLTIPKLFKQSLLDHLIEAFDNKLERAKERVDTNIDVDLIIGLKDLHFELCEHVELSAFTRKPGAKQPLLDHNSPFSIEEETDAWDSALNRVIGEGSLAKLDTQDSASKKPTQVSYYKARAVNKSLGGYRLHWQGEIPHRLRTGEVIGIREPGRCHFAIAIVRWLRQTKHAGELGVLVLAAQAEPYAAATILREGGKSEFMHALLLPPGSAECPTHSLLVNQVAFKLKNKIILNQRGKTQEGLLDEQLLSSSSMTLFHFRQLAAIHSTASDEEHFDHL